MKVAIFDFDNTLININTSSSFINFVINGKIKSNFLRKWLFRHRKILSKFRIYSSRKIGLKCLFGIEEKLLYQFGHEYYQSFIKNKLDEGIVNQLINLKNNGFKIIIISGSFSLYLKYLSEILPADLIVSSDLLFKKGICLGCISGISTTGKGKIKKFKKEYKDYNNINFKESYFFTDNLDDEPNLKLVGNPIFIIDKNNKKISVKKIDRIKKIKNIKIISNN